LDALDGVIAFGTQGLHETSSFDEGIRTAVLGCVLHFFIAFVASTVYVFASRWIPALRKAAVTLGLLCGVAVYLFMNYVVLPLGGCWPELVQAEPRS